MSGLPPIEYFQKQNHIAVNITGNGFGLKYIVWIDALNTFWNYLRYLLFIRYISYSIHFGSFYIHSIEFKNAFV